MRRHSRLRDFARLWAIPKPLAPAAMASNAPLATNGLASNPSRNMNKNFVINTASLKLAPAPEDKSESVKPATVNTLTVPAHLVISGTIRLKHVKTLVLSARCIIATALARKIN